MWLANTGKVRAVVNAGVIAVKLEVFRDNKCVLVHSLEGQFRLSSRGTKGKMEIARTLVRYDP